MGRPAIHGKAMTPAERKQRQRAKAREAAFRLSHAEASVAPSTAPRRQDPNLALMRKFGIERQAYVTLLTPTGELAEIAEVKGKAAELVEQMNADQRVALGRVARRAMPVLTFLADLPDDARALIVAGLAAGK